ncbi:MAG: hypothetical protein AAFX85_03495 [Pseudomonadota bacterium]
MSDPSGGDALKKNRHTLKNLFAPGQLVSAESFQALIDSNLNMVDEGFEKTPEYGLKISSIGNHSALLSLYTPDNRNQPKWQIRYDEGRQRLVIEAQDGVTQQEQPPLLTLSREGRLGVNAAAPEETLDVAGSLRSHARLGVTTSDPTWQPPEPVVADGQWKQITPVLSGCHALEVVAGAGLRRSGKWTLMHAMALNAYHPTGWLFNLFGAKRRIRCTHAWYHQRGDKLRLRWRRAGADGDRAYVLEIRSNADYGGEPPVPIRYHITQLWTDPFMDEGAGDVRGADGGEGATS